MTSFQYEARIIDNYPNLVAGVVVARGMTNGPTPASLQELYLAEQAAVKARIGAAALSELPSLSAWRRAISAFGVSPTKYRSAAEALLRRLTKKGDIPSINVLVDIGNLVSIRYGLPVAIFDRRQIAGPITVHYADGSEEFVELGSQAIIHPAPGEVVFSDDKRMVVARRWCWRQSATSAASQETTDAVVTVEAQHEGGQEDIERALEDLLTLLPEYAGGSFDAAVLGSGSSAI
ncbi:MAG: phenylalanine--tRNA ligase beta subunit-related protein [Chloroflexota bacterium]|nr:phenylalanine--tRNA ligase beta subunit-related protein [Chloroflexota bacterium]